MLAILQVRFDPSRKEALAKVPMCDEQDITALSASFALSILHLGPVFAVHLANALNGRINPFCHFLDRLACRAAVAEDVPVRFALMDLLGRNAFVFAIIPLANVFRGLGRYGKNVSRTLVALEEQIESSLTSLARRLDDFGQRIG